MNGVFLYVKHPELDLQMNNVTQCILIARLNLHLLSNTLQNILTQKALILSTPNPFPSQKAWCKLLLSYLFSKESKIDNYIDFPHNFFTNGMLSKSGIRFYIIVINNSEFSTDFELQSFSKPQGLIPNFINNFECFLT